MKNKIYGFFLFLFYVLIIFYIVMFVITYIEEKNVDDTNTNENTTEVEENYDTDQDNHDITDRTSPKELVDEYDDDVKGFFGRLFAKIKKFFTSDRDGRNLFEITNENIFNLFRKDKEPEPSPNNSLPNNNNPNSLTPNDEYNEETDYQTEY